MLLKALTFGIAISFISWMVGMILNGMLAKTQYYEKLSNLNFIKGKALNKSIGMDYFKWIVKNTFFKFFNQGIKVESRNVELATIRKEMTLAEVSHLIAFVFVIPFAIYKSFSQGVVFGPVIMLVNVLMNLYPSLLQQENKRRIDGVIQRQMKAVASKQRQQ